MIVHADRRLAELAGSTCLKYLRDAFDRGSDMTVKGRRQTGRADREHAFHDPHNARVVPEASPCHKSPMSTEQKSPYSLEVFPCEKPAGILQWAIRERESCAALGSKAPFGRQGPREWSSPDRPSDPWWRGPAIDPVEGREERRGRVRKLQTWSGSQAAVAGALRHRTDRRSRRYNVARNPRVNVDRHSGGFR